MVRIGTFPLVAVAVTGCLFALSRMPAARMPQAQAGEDFFSVVLGDAKKDLSGVMLREADSYFHGGVDMDCTLHDHEGEQGCHCGHHREHDDHGEVHPSRTAFDPWRWINAHVRAPEIERHLAQDKIVEMMPWFWVAVKADPHNVEAWTAAWYSAARLMRNPPMALKVAEEGARQNPDSIALLCVIGRTYRQDGFVDDVKAEGAFRRARELGLSRCAGNPSGLSEDDQDAFLQALDYLSHYAARRGEIQSLGRLLEEARRTRPDHAVVENIKIRLKQKK